MAQPKLPPHIQKHAPKRAAFKTKREYEEAVAFFRHRLKSIPAFLLKGSRPK